MHAACPRVGLPQMSSTAAIAEASASPVRSARLVASAAEGASAEIPEGEATLLNRGLALLASASSLELTVVCLGRRS